MKSYCKVPRPDKQKPKRQINYVGGEKNKFKLPNCKFHPKKESVMQIAGIPLCSQCGDKILEMDL